MVPDEFGRWSIDLPDKRDGKWTVPHRRRVWNPVSDILRFTDCNPCLCEHCRYVTSQIFATTFQRTLEIHWELKIRRHLKSEDGHHFKIQNANLILILHALRKRYNSCTCENIQNGRQRNVSKHSSRTTRYT